MNVNATAWGAPFTEYSGLNVRTGASDLTDTDFEDYPPFVRNSFDTETEIQYIPKGDLYYPYLDDNDIINLNKPIERSIAYCACKNLDIPINQIYGYSCTPDSASNQYPSLADSSAIMLQSDNTPIPIMLLDTVGIGQARTHGMSASQHYFRNPFYRTSQGVFNQQNLWTQYAKNEDISGNQGTPYDNTGRARSNKNLFAAYYRDFGIRSMFLQIRVKYYNSISSSTETPSGLNDKTLYWYRQQTSDWKEAHPLTGAYGRLIVRSNVNGTYAQANNVNPDVTINLKSNWAFGDVSIGDLIQQPISNVDTEYLQSAFPIFGVQAPNNWQVTETGTHANGGISQNVAILIGGGANSPIVHHQGKENTQYYGTMWCELAGTNENLELLRKWCAAYGLFFTDGDTGDTGYSDLYAAGNDETRWTDDKMCLGVIDDEGMTDGTYTRGTGNETANNWTWKTASESKYNPDKPPPTPDNQYSDTTVFNSIGDLATMFKRYVISASEVETLGKDLFKITDDLAVATPSYDEYATKVNSQFLVSNPLDCVISLRRFPMEIPKDGTYTNIKLGTNTINTSGYGMEKTAYTYLFEMSNPIYPNFGDSFLDYEPYTTYELYVPFCGTVKLNPRDIIGRKLAVQMVVDFTTGTATGFVMSGNLVIETVNGNVAIDIPVAGVNAATVASQLNNAIAQESTSYNNKYTAGFDLAKSMINPLSWGGGSIVGKFGSALNAETSHQLADYNLHHQDATPHSIGAASPVGLWAIDLNCRLICYFPTGDVITKQGDTPKLNSKIYEYGANTGFATIETNAIGSYTGLVVATNPLLGSITTQQGKALTDDEIQGIISDLAEGVIV